MTPLTPDGRLEEGVFRALIDALVPDLDGLFVLDCIASGALWVDMTDLDVDVLLSAPQKGWSGSPCANSDGKIAAPTGEESERGAWMGDPNADVDEQLTHHGGVLDQRADFDHRGRRANRTEDLAVRAGRFFPAGNVRDEKPRAHNVAHLRARLFERRLDVA